MLDRRRVLRFGALAAAGALVSPRAVLAATARRSLTIVNAHNGESCTAEYYVDGWYNPDALAAFDHLLRDRRTEEETAIDPGLLDILHDLQTLMEGRPIELVCGYRSPATNAMLAATRSGVAGNSFHIYGRAADIRVPGFGLDGLHDLALGLEAGGVGYYPSSNFVHVDTGPVRTWS